MTEPTTNDDGTTANTPPTTTHQPQLLPLLLRATAHRVGTYERTTDNDAPPAPSLTSNCSWGGSRVERRWRRQGERGVERGAMRMATGPQQPIRGKTKTRGTTTTVTNVPSATPPLPQNEGHGEARNARNHQDKSPMPRHPPHRTDHPTTTTDPAPTPSAVSHCS
jgi:hypothetical protein